MSETTNSISQSHLVPSQTIGSHSSSGGSRNSNAAAGTSTTTGQQRTGNNNKSRRNKNNRQKNKASNGSAVPPSHGDERQPSAANNGKNSNDKTTNQQRNNNNNNNKPPLSGDDKKKHQQKRNDRRKKQQNRRRRNRNNNKYPWRPQIPDESVDPITLESLHTLPYPPFALFAELPYEPIEVWPFPHQDPDAAEGNQKDETEEERQQRILQEQWGSQLTVPEDSDADKKPSASAESPANRHVHLYDGRALAYYMVSQLQFIDPLNRRDLTRDELVNLDGYLRRHGFNNLNVTEAYDAKGVTISRAGAAADTAAGRAAILQQEAAVLLNALFGGPRTSAPNRPAASASTPTTTSLAASYQAHEQQQQQQQRQRGGRQRQQQQNVQNGETEDTGIYGDAGGILVIDDDINPGLRGTNSDLRVDANEFVPNATGPAPYTLWSASHIASQFGHQAQARAAEFPALEPQKPPPSVDNNTRKKPLPKSNTLAKIAVSVKKTDPEQRQRMWEAHEKWQHRTMMSSLTFGAPTAPTNGGNTLGSHLQLAASTAAAPSEAQLERNRAFAQALGVKPSTARQPAGGGWARPTSNEGDDEYGKELNAAVYPEELVAEARDKLALLIKLERRWKLFLEDDKAASLPLWAMDRPTRTFVHHYSDFWRLNTESFDPEPKRYIHCVKLLDTRAPYPLLSDVVRGWKGKQQEPQLSELPRGPAAAADHHLQQTAGQATTQTSARWDGLGRSDDSDAPQERPRLELQKRTLPLELPPYQPPTAAASDSTRFEEERKVRQQRMEEKARKEREQVEAQRRALEAAFASDDDGSGGSGPRAALNDGDESDWTEAEEQFDGSSSSEED